MVDVVSCIVFVQKVMDCWQINEKLNNVFFFVV